MSRMIALTLLATLGSSPAAATGEAYCQAADGSGAQFEYGFGRVPGLAIVNATIRADGGHWSTIANEGVIPIIVAQGAMDNMYTIIDFADPEYTRILASVRLVSVVEGDDFATVGTLQIAGIGAFPMVCE